MLEAAVPVGRHVIHLWYLPERLVIGAWLALVTLAALLAWAVWPLARRRKRPESVCGRFGGSFVTVLEKAESAGRERDAAMKSRS
jgi:membrane protein implicated in regulation of membrane protease activity